MVHIFPLPSSLSQILIPTYFTYDTYFPNDILFSTFFDVITYPFQINVLHFIIVKTMRKTCNDAILSWTDPRTPSHATFWFLCENNVIICFVRYKNCEMYSHLQYMCNKHALLVNRIHKLRWQCLTCCTVTWHRYTHSLLPKTMPAKLSKLV